MNGKEGIKLILFIDYVIVYKNNWNESVKKQLKLNNFTVSPYTRSIYRNYLYMLATIKKFLKIKYHLV